MMKLNFRFDAVDPGVGYLRNIATGMIDDDLPIKVRPQHRSNDKEHYIFHFDLFYSE